MKKWMITAILLLMAGGVSAQDYQTAAGLRGGFVSGITVKHFTDDKNALEGILSFGRFGFNVTGLYEVHARAFDVEGLNWFYGGGAHIGQWNDEYPTMTKLGSYMVLGLDGIVGLEYNIPDIPIVLGTDWKPAINFSGYPGFLGFGGGISVRYTF